MFDPDEVARLELEWWIVHREVDDHPPGDLEAALAALAAELYQVPAERLRAHASRRAASTATALQARSPTMNSSREVTATTAAAGTVTVEPSSSSRAASRTPARPAPPPAGGRWRRRPRTPRC
ncbi:MAG TPA: hypothetical protein VFJ69_07355, partial [Actinomycetota bacterium]|nr:hypothetical protein [Actinomycetota bacterium]